MTCMGKAKLYQKDPLVSERNLCVVKNAPNHKQGHKLILMYLYSRVIGTLIYSQSRSGVFVVNGLMNS